MKYFEEKKAFFSAFLVGVKRDLYQSLEKERSRFPSCDKLLGKFREFRLRFTKEFDTLSPEEMDRFIREATELVNEICVAQKILAAPSEEVARLDYEHPLPCTCRTIDFRLTAADGRATWWDLKTIHPEEKDDWDQV